MILPLVRLMLLVVGLNVARYLERAAELKVMLLLHSGNCIVHLAVRLFAARLLAARPLAWRSVAQAR